MVKEAQSQSRLPEEIKALPHWTPHINKRPVIAPNKWDEGLSYDQVVAQSPHAYGILVAPAEVTPYLFIDIDYPDEHEKEAIMVKLQEKNIKWGTPEHLELISATLKSIESTPLYPLLSKTYAEFSPSGTGIRMIIQSRDKPLFAKAYKKATSFKGQIDFKNQFVTITEVPFPGSPSLVEEVKLLELVGAFNFKKIDELVLIDSKKTAPELGAELCADIQVPGIETIEAALRSIPIDQTPRVQKAWYELTGEKYEHYHFWLSVGMALREYSTHFKNPSRIYKAYLEWSQKDKIAYTGEEDVWNKWASFDGKVREEAITWRTLIKLANTCTFEYPRPILVKGKNTGNPMVNEWINFEYLLNFYNIKLHEDDAYYVSGDKDICERYFTAHGAQCWFDKYYGPLSVQALQAATLRLCQDSKWRGLSSTAGHVATWITLPRDDMDLFQLWLDTPFEELPEELRTVPTADGRAPVSAFNRNSTVDYVFEMLNVQYTQPMDRALAKSLLKKTLMQMIKFREPLTLPFTDNGGMLILIGAENTYKSTFFKLLLPQPLNHLRKELNMQVKGEKSVRDFIRNLGKKTIVQIDEFEGMMDHAKQGSLFKAIISGDTASITDIYQTSENEVQRKAIIVGTSNEMRQVLSDNGSRRMWFIKVNKINTNGMLQINLHKLYNDLRDEFRSEYAQGRMPWLLTQEEINHLYKMNESLAAKNDIAMWLDQIWSTAEPMQEDYLHGITNVQKSSAGIIFSTRDIYQLLVFKGMPTTVKLSAIERTLERYCGKWTNSFGKHISLVRPKAVLMNGRICQGTLPTGKFKYMKWVMPPMIENDPE